MLRLRSARGRAPDPDRAARLSRAQLAAALRHAKRRNIEVRAGQLRAPALRQPAAVQKAYAAIVVGQVRLIVALDTEINALGEVVAEHFGRHRDAEIYLSQPGLGTVLSAWVLAEFGDDPHRFADAKSRKNYAGTSPITRASGTRRIPPTSPTLIDRTAGRRWTHEPAVWPPGRARMQGCSLRMRSRSRSTTGQPAR